MYVFVFFVFLQGDNSYSIDKESTDKTGQRSRARGERSEVHSEQDVRLYIVF